MGMLIFFGRSLTLLDASSLKLVKVVPHLYGHILFYLISQHLWSHSSKEFPSSSSSSPLAPRDKELNDLILTIQKRKGKITNCLLKFYIENSPNLYTVADFHSTVYFPDRFFQSIHLLARIQVCSWKNK